VDNNKTQPIKREKEADKPSDLSTLRRTDHIAEVLSKDIVHALKKVGDTREGNLMHPDLFYDEAVRLVKGTVSNLSDSYNHSELSITSAVISDLRTLAEGLAANTPGIPNAQVFVIIHNGLLPLSAEIREISSKSEEDKAEFIGTIRFFEIWREILIYGISMQNESVETVASDVLSNVSNARVRKQMEEAKNGIVIYKSQNLPYAPDDPNKKNPSDCHDFGF
jgi:hypothetical protein